MGNTGNFGVMGYVGDTSYMGNIIGICDNDDLGDMGTMSDTD